MGNELKMNPQETTIRGLLAEYLTSHKASNVVTPHVDHDTLAAFTEGNLNERESIPVVSHLVDCSFCRHITADLVRLELEFAGEHVAAKVPSEQPSRISQVLSSLLAKMFGTTENTVFAHHEDEKKDEDPEKEDAEKKD